VALPNLIDDGTNAFFPIQNSYVGPFQSSGGDFYAVLVETGPAVVVVYKATNPVDDTWVEQDGGNNPAATPSSIWAEQDGDTLHIVTQDPLSGGGKDIEYHTFSMSSDTWGTTDELIETATDGSQHRGCSLGIRSTGASPIVLYMGDSDKVKGIFYERVDFARRNGSWTVGILAFGPGNDELDYHGSVIVRGSGDNLHVFCKDEGVNPEHLLARTIDGAAASPGSSDLSTTRSFSYGAQTTAGPSAGDSDDDAGTQRVFVPIKTTGAVARFEEDGSGDLSALFGQYSAEPPKASALFVTPAFLPRTP